MPPKFKTVFFNPVRIFSEGATPPCSFNPTDFPFANIFTTAQKNYRLHEIIWEIIQGSFFINLAFYNHCKNV